MRRVALLSLMAAIGLPGLSGCVAMRAQVDGVEGRVAQLERSQAGFLSNAERETQRLANLAAEVEAQNGQVRESLARTTARLQDFERQNAKLRGELEEAVRRLAVVEQTGGGASTQIAQVRAQLDRLIADLRDRAGIAILALPADLPADGPGFASLAEAKWAAKEVRVAAAVAAECQKRFEGTESAGRCGIVLGQIATEEQRYADATRILQGVHDSLDGKAVPVVGQALLDISRVLELQGRCGNAQKVLKYITTEMPKLPQAKTAKELLLTADKRCKEGVGPGAATAPAPAEAPASSPAPAK
jgi:TolA-binding protein